MVARLLYVAAFLWLARMAGVEALGEFGFALTVASYLSLCVQLGIDQVAVREVSRFPVRLASYSRPILGLRLFLAGSVYSLLLIYAKTAHFSYRAAILLAICGLTSFSSALSTRWAFQSQNRPKPLALATIAAQLVFAAGVSMAKGPNGVYWAAGAQVAGEWLAAILLYVLLRPRDARGPRWEPQFNRKMLLNSWPISVSLFLGNLLYSFDVLALGWLAEPSQVGLYLAVYRCATVFSPILSMLQISILPEFSRAYPDQKKLRSLARGILAPTLAICCALGLFLAVFAVPVLRTLYGTQYLQGAALLRILCWSLPFQGMRSVLRQVLVACHWQRRDSLNMGLAVLTSVTLDLLLVPRFGAYACAWATVAAEFVLFVFSFRAAWQATRAHP